MDEKHILILKHKDKRTGVITETKYIKYLGLLDLAHKTNLKDLTVDILQFPNESNGYTCICVAVAKFVTENKDIKIFSDIGDANPKNVTSMIVPHLIRMASTRAKARVLRDALNVDMVAFEELGEGQAENANKFAEPSSPITEDQAGEIAEWIDKTNTNATSFLSWANADSIGELPSNKYEESINLLKERYTVQQEKLKGQREPGDDDE